MRVALAAVQHPRVADDVARRIVVIGANEAVAIQALIEGNFAVPEGAEHLSVQWRYGLLLQHAWHASSLRRPCSWPRAERSPLVRRTALRCGLGPIYAPE